MKLTKEEQELLAQDWAATIDTLRHAAGELIGLPADIEEELKASVVAFRGEMSWTQQVRETFLASLAALPPLLGVAYTLLTANPVTGGGIWIRLESVFGLNDLWALVSIPASVGLGERERKHLEQLIAPVFRLWLERRVVTIVGLYRDSVCRPVLVALERVPSPEDERLAQVARALDALAVERRTDGNPRRGVR